MNFFGYVRKTHDGSYYVTIPAAFARSLMKQRGMTTLDGEEVHVEVTL